MKRKIALTFIVVILSALAIEAMAQGCPMCKTSLEEARKNGSMVGNTLNNGILYLLALPYLVIAAFGVIWYRNAKAKKAKASIVK
jgi:high-affinity nickel permease